MRKKYLLNAKSDAPVGLEINILVSLCTYIDTLPIPAVKALASPHSCIGSPEPSVLDKAILANYNLNSQHADAKDRVFSNQNNSFTSAPEQKFSVSFHVRKCPFYTPNMTYRLA